MEEILQLFEQVQRILVRALPTFLLVILLHWFLKKVLFVPMQRTLAARHGRTEGAVDAAEARLADAARKVAAYEKALAEARGEIYREQDAHRRQLAARQAALLEAERGRMSGIVQRSRGEISTEARRAREALAAQSEALSEQITAALLGGRAR